MRDAPGPGGGPVLAMYARIACLEQPVPGDMTEYWGDPVSSFVINGGRRTAPRRLWIRPAWERVSSGRGEPAAREC
jgi:hypothetical protein